MDSFFIFFIFFLFLEFLDTWEFFEIISDNMFGLNDHQQKRMKSFGVSLKNHLIQMTTSQAYDFFSILYQAVTFVCYHVENLGMISTPLNRLFCVAHSFLLSMIGEMTPKKNSSSRHGGGENNVWAGIPSMELVIKDALTTSWRLDHMDDFSLRSFGEWETQMKTKSKLQYESCSSIKEIIEQSAVMLFESQSGAMWREAMIQVFDLSLSLGSEESSNNMMVAAGVAATAVAWWW